MTDSVKRFAASADRRGSRVSQTLRALPQRRLVPCPRHMRLRDGYPDRLKIFAVPPELAVARSLGQPIVDMPRQELGRGVLAGELGNSVQVLVVQWFKHRFQNLVGAADIDHNAVCVEGIGDEG